MTNNDAVLTEEALVEIIKRTTTINDFMLERSRLKYTSDKFANEYSLLYISVPLVLERTLLDPDITFRCSG